MSKKQISVEWLVRKLSTELIGEIPLHRWDEIREAVQQAKAMHREEIIESYCQGCLDITNDDSIFPRETSEQYYKETFGEQE